MGLLLLASLASEVDLHENESGVFAVSQHEEVLAQLEILYDASNVDELGNDPEEYWKSAVALHALEDNQRHQCTNAEG